MTATFAQSIDHRLYVLQNRWDLYQQQGQFEQFIEFAVTINSLAEHLNRMRLPGLVRLCEGLENLVLSHLGDASGHPITEANRQAILRQVETLKGAIATARPQATERRADEAADANATEVEWIKPRSIWVVSVPERREWIEGLCGQLRYFGFKVSAVTWGQEGQLSDMPLAVLLVPGQGTDSQIYAEHIAALRSRCPTSQLFFLGAPAAIEPIVALMRTGVDVAIPEDEQDSMVLDRILDLVQHAEQEKYRVLVVEDSRVAVALIQRTLSEHGIDSQAVRDPATLLEALASYRPDLILMDMQMPRFSGIEATRVLRQISAYSTLPIVYLSGASEVGMQVEALRLGGDQFLTKPFNPVLLAAVVKTKIERFRETLRSTKLDGLTGLLNHTAAKSRLNALIKQAGSGPLTVAMIDIDHFKGINDSYGHPVGDQVIRALAWLLKGRLRSGDLIGRYGGEEFMIALPGVGPDQAKVVIDRIRVDFAALPHAHPGGALHATFSAGLSGFPWLESAAALTEAADAALLQAKRLGRNRVERGV